MEPSTSTGCPSGPVEPKGLAPAAGRTPPGQEASAWDEPRALARLIDQTAQPFEMLDLDGRIVRVNRAYEALTGYAAHELIGRDVLDLTEASSRRDTAEELAALRATGQGCRYEKMYRRKDGRAVPVEVVADALRDDRGAIHGFFAFLTDVSERRQAERALRESEERFRRLYDEAPIGYDELDLDGVLVNINRTECELLGYDRSEMLGLPVFDFLVEGEREASRQAIGQMIRGERPAEPTERTYLTRDGRPLILAIEHRLRRDPRGNVVGLRRTVRDVTGKRQAEAALVASERRARALFEGIEDAVFVHDLEGKILDANPAACRRLGYTREELLHITTREIDAEDFAAGFRERLDRQVRTGSLSVEGKHKTKDGRVIPVDINSSIILYEGQRVVLGVMRDISERKALEEARRRLEEARLEAACELEAKHRELARSEARYRQLTEGCLDAVVVADASGRIVLFNPAAERTFGYTAAEILDKPISRLMPEEYRGPHDAGFARYLETRDPRVVGRTVELRGRRKDGTDFPLELSLNAVDVAGELQFIGSIRDQAERQRMRAMLAQSDKLASIGLLSAGVAHEINNPLAYIANNLAVLERDLKGVLAMMAGYESARNGPDGGAAAALARIDEVAEELDWAYVRENLPRLITRTREGVQRVANIVQNLRGLARTSPTKMEEVAVEDLLASALELLQGRLRRRGIELAVDLPPALPKLRCVASQIGQVLLNLLVNAVQAIEATERPEGNRLRVSAREAGEFHAIEIEDNGPGIDPDHLARLFDPFFTTKPVGEGTGLGLSISHGIVTGHGGRIDVESRPGQGTCFRVLLPCGPAHPHADPPRPTGLETTPR